MSRKRESCSQNVAMQALLTLKQLRKERVCPVAPTFYNWTITEKHKPSSHCQIAERYLATLQSIAATVVSVQARERVRLPFVDAG